MHNRTSLSILKLSEEDRPREKLLLKGRQSLTDAELLAIILGSGNKDQNAVELAQTILLEAQNKLNELAKFSVNDLMKFKGVGEAKAINVISALELGRRRKSEIVQRKPKITCSSDAYEIISAELLDLYHEEFWLLLLNRANEVMKKIKVGTGGVSGVMVDPKIVFSKALEHLTSSIILIHNHPSGNLKPSEADKSITNKIIEGGKVLEIAVLDHLIFTNHGYYSFADEGIL